MDKDLILNEIKKHYKFNSDVDFANFLGIKTTRLSNWRKRNTLDYELISTICEDINANWLITGKGSMLKGSSTESIESIKSIKKDNQENIIPAKPTSPSDPKGIPLIPTYAIAGAFTGDLQVLECDCEHFIIPTFKGADFLIPVKGASMEPKYSSGDLVACKKMAIDTFFQWNKVYVLDTEQGPLIKRINEGSNKDTLLICSENPQYPPFELKRSLINNIALVVGVIRLE